LTTSPQRRYTRICEVESLATNISPAKIKPSKWFYVVGIVVLIVGPVVSSVFLFSTIFSNLGNMAEIPSVQVVVPGSSDITLSQEGKYTIFYEYRSLVGNRIYSTGEEIPGLQINLVSKETGNEIPLSGASVNRTYTVGSRSGIGLLDFVIEQPGVYELSASYPPVQGPREGGGGEQNQEIVLAVIHGTAIDKLFGSITATVASFMAVILVPFVAGIVIIVITFIKRRKAVARARTTT
jgi:hypothetical protein